MQHEIQGAAQHLGRALKQVLQVGGGGGVGRDDLGMAGFGQHMDLPHAQGDGRVGEGDGSAFLHGALSDFPGDGTLVQRSEDDAFLPFQQLMCHGRNFGKNRA